MTALCLESDSRGPRPGAREYEGALRRGVVLSSNSIKFYDTLEQDSRSPRPGAREYEGALRRGEVLHCIAPFWGCTDPIHELLKGPYITRLPRGDSKQCIQ